MSTIDIQSAIGDTLLQVVLQQKAKAKALREQKAAANEDIKVAKAA